MLFDRQRTVCGIIVGCQLFVTNIIIPMIPTKSILHDTVFAIVLLHYNFSVYISNFLAQQNHGYCRIKMDSNIKLQLTFNQTFSLFSVYVL